MESSLFIFCISMFHIINYALYPHEGDRRFADVIGFARSYGTPPLPYHTDAHGGDLPKQLVILNLKESKFVATAFMSHDLEFIRSSMQLPWPPFQVTELVWQPSS